MKTMITSATLIMIQLSFISAQTINDDKISSLTQPNEQLNTTLASAGLDHNDITAFHWMDFEGDGDFDLIAVANDEMQTVLVLSYMNKEFHLAMKTDLDNFYMPELDMMAEFPYSVNVVWYDENGDGYKDFMLFPVDPKREASTFYSNGDGTYTQIFASVDRNN